MSARRGKSNSIDQFDKAFKLDLDFRGKLFDTPNNPSFTLSKLNFSTLKTEAKKLPNLRERKTTRRKAKRRRPSKEQIIRRTPLARKPLPKQEQEVEL
jgi:hypothetical protein